MIKRFLFLILAISFSIAYSQTNVTVDSEFNPTDTGNGAGDGPNAGIDSVIKLPSGKILIIGNLSKYNTTIVSKMAVIDANGNLDTTFNQGGSGVNGKINSAVVQSDGKIIIAGDFLTYNGVNSKKMVRLNADGTIDTSFNIGDGFNNTVSYIKLQGDGKILAGGNFTQFNGDDAFRIVRLNSNGSIDYNFAPSGANNFVTSIDVDENNNVLIGGNFTQVNGVNVNRFARLTSTGDLDSSFNIGTGASNNVSYIQVIGGKIYLAGSFTKFNEVNANRIIRLNQDGSQDTSFDFGTGFNSNVSYVTLCQNKLIVTGDFTSYKDSTVGRIVALNTDGTVDNTFNFGKSGGTGSGYVSQIVDVDNGSFIVGGYFISFNDVGKQYLSKITTDGTVDMNFNPNIGVSRDVLALDVAPDKSVVFGGYVGLVNNSIVQNLAKTDANGNLNISFAANMGKGFNNAVKGVRVLSSGKILATGDFTTFNNTSQVRAIVLNADGSKDDTFQVADGFNNAINATAETSDGKIVMAGSFTTYAGKTSNRIIRLNTDGTADTSFNIGSGVGNSVNAIAIQNDGKIIIGGSFNAYNGTTINRIARLNSDGSLDTNFNVGTGVNYPVAAIAIQPDGKIVIGGNFTQVNGTSSINRIARLNADGSLDTTFTIGTGLDSNPNSIILQSDGKIILTGDFTKYNGTVVSRIFRIKSDGSYDSSFNVGASSNNTIKAIAFQNNKKLIIGGNFTNFDGVGKNRLARLLINDDPLATSDSSFAKRGISVYPNPAKSSIFIRTESKAYVSAVFDISGRKVLDFSGNTTNIESLKPGVYFIKTTFDNGKAQTQKLIKQ